MKKYYVKNTSGDIRTGLLEQLQQLTSLTWDGDLLSKDQRNKLVDKGYATKVSGYNIISPSGICLLSDLELIKP